MNLASKFYWHFRELGIIYQKSVATIQGSLSAKQLHMPFFRKSFWFIGCILPSLYTPSSGLVLNCRSSVAEIKTNIKEVPEEIYTRTSRASQWIGFGWVAYCYLKTKYGLFCFHISMIQECWPWPNLLAYSVEIGFDKWFTYCQFCVVNFVLLYTFFLKNFR